MILLQSRRKTCSSVKLFAAAAIALAITVHSAHASDATWNLNPVDNNWHNAANWTPAIVPDTRAMFDTSSITDISAEGTIIDSIVFNSSATTFTISSGNFSITGFGVINNSGTAQNFLSESCGMNCGSINFFGNATVSGAVTLMTEGDPDGDYAWGSYVAFYDTSSAGDGTYHNQGGSVGESWGGVTYFYGSSTAGNGTFIIDGGTVEGTGPGTIWFWNNSSAGNATIIANGSTVSGAGGGIISLGAPVGGSASLGNATFICNGGVNGGGGGSIWFNDYTGGRRSTARVELFGNGTMLVKQAGRAGVDIGSLEGDGIVLLGRRTLSVGRNNLDTIFAGLIANDGDDNFNAPFSGSIQEKIEEDCYPTCPALTKTGTGRLTLTGANTYSGTTTVTSGTFVASNISGSATGTSAVNVEAGTLGGKGIIQGAVTIGTGSSTGAFLAPSVGTNRLVTLTLSSTLTFKADGTYAYKLNMNNARADQAITNGVTIESGAQFSFQSIGRRRLPVGTVFTVISNTSANPITGAFVNLPDGSTLTAGRNNFQVSYSGGDGNDLTLTVVP